MKSNRECDLGSWKCGKGRTFTRIPTHFFAFFEIRFSKTHPGKEERKSLCLKKSNINRFLEVLPKKLLTISESY